MEETNKSNPKALNLDVIKQSQTKVTLGFKCNPNVKLDLAQKADKIGLTLSEYVENLIMNSERLTEKYQAQEKEEKEKLNQTIKEQKDRIDFYESDLLEKLFDKFKNKTASYKDENDKPVNLKISDIKSLFTVIINSFKIKENGTDTNTISFS
ncbi:MAG: hypothetical protein U0T79_11240 [Ferruginibacter sp.]